jgi:Acyl-CoA dehydrogenase, N-terminal domain
MDFALSDEQQPLRQQVRLFAKQELNGDVKDRDRHHTLPKNVWLKCGDMGLHGTPRRTPRLEYVGGSLTRRSSPLKAKHQVISAPAVKTSQG